MIRTPFSVAWIVTLCLHSSFGVVCLSERQKGMFIWWETNFFGGLSTVSEKFRISLYAQGHFSSDTDTERSLRCVFFITYAPPRSFENIKSKTIKSTASCISICPTLYDFVVNTSVSVRHRHNRQRPPMDCKISLVYHNTTQSCRVEPPPLPGLNCPMRALFIRLRIYKLPKYGS